MGFFQKITKSIFKPKKEKKIKNTFRAGTDFDFFNQNKVLSWGLNNSKISRFDLNQIAMLSDICQNVFGTLVNEMFRGGFEISTDATFDVEHQKNKLEKVIKKCNLNNQSLVELLKEFENDLNIQDDAFLLARKNYFLNQNNQIIGAEVVEFFRVDPLSIEMIFDKSNRLGVDEFGSQLFFDIENRRALTKNKINKNGIKNFVACFKIRSGDGFEYYGEDEVLHVSKYHPSKTYGFSPLFSLYNKIITLINMDYYVKQYYSGNKVPKSLLIVNTTNIEGFNAGWNKFLSKVKQNPHGIHPLVHQSKNGSESISFTDFMRNFQEMQFTETRNEMRTQIGAVYNVSPMFLNDVSTGGGLNNEGLQVTVTDRGIEMGQQIYNEKVLSWICEQLGISHYVLSLVQSKEIDRVAEKDLRLKDIEIARATAELGIKVSMNADGEFSFGAGVVELQNSSETGIFGIGKSVEKNEEKELENTLLLELKKLLKKLKFKKNFDVEDVDAKVLSVMNDFEKKIKNKTDSKLKKIYKKAMLDVGKDVDEKFSFSSVDENVLNSLKKDPVFENAFFEMRKDLSEKLKDVIVAQYEKPDGFSMNELVGEMRDSVDDVEYRLRRIARTETSKISVASRKTQYDKTGEDYLFFHVGVNDGRTTKMSKEVKMLTKDGVSWNDYVEIIKQVAKKYNPKWVVNENAPITHPNTRHIFVAKKNK